MGRSFGVVAGAAALLVPVVSLGGTATAAQARLPASDPASQCAYQDAYPPGGGTDLGGTPKRFKYADTPYAGARFDECANTLRVYYGGYSSPRYTYYEVRYTYPSRPGWYSWQLRMGEYRVATVDAPARGDWNFKVRACAGAIDEAGPGSCTAWSPQLFLHAV
ncbi:MULTISPECIES: hypothetical protein [Streptomyces]|uniref:hypothetical protein n=1 Tax=Streptomyces TaxID=1883 RepID=UPI000A7DF57D|nr:MULTISPECIES: hypothetical protein [Streptomyces]